LLADAAIAAVQQHAAPAVLFNAAVPVMQYKLVHISVGDLLRAEVAAGTPAGRRAQSFMDSGNLVPSEVLLPRRLFQAQSVSDTRSPSDGTLSRQAVSDESDRMWSQVVVDMVKTRLGAEDAQSFGWLLDGYPRSAEQAEAIEAVSIRPDIFILINVRAPTSCTVASNCWA